MAHVRHQQGKTRKLFSNRQPSAAPLSPGPGKPTFGAQVSAYDLRSRLDSTALLAFLDKLQDPSSRRLGSDVLIDVIRLRHSQKASKPALSACCARLNGAAKSVESFRLEQFALQYQFTAN